jgi:hypothetical protein
LKKYVRFGDKLKLRIMVILSSYFKTFLSLKKNILIKLFLESLEFSLKKKLLKRLYLLVFHVKQKSIGTITGNRGFGNMQ